MVRSSAVPRFRTMRITQRKTSPWYCRNNDSKASWSPAANRSRSSTLSLHLLLLPVYPRGYMIWGVSVRSAPGEYPYGRHIASTFSAVASRHSNEDSVIDIPNAFIGRNDQPTATEVSSALGKGAALWTDLVAWFAEEAGVADEEWKSISPKYGWSLRLSVKKRNIVHLSPCKGCF